MDDHSARLEDLKSMIEKFCTERDWDQYHGAKDLAIGLVTESSELLELFRFVSEDSSEELLLSAKKRQAIGQEMADVFYFLLRFAQKYDFDLASELVSKLSANEKRYPTNKFKGRNEKSSEL